MFFDLNTETFLNSSKLLALRSYKRLCITFFSFLFFPQNGLRYVSVTNSIENEPNLRLRFIFLLVLIFFFKITHYVIAM